MQHVDDGGAKVISTLEFLTPLQTFAHEIWVGWCHA